MKRLMIGLIIGVLPNLGLAQMVIPRSAPLAVQAPRVEAEQPVPETFTPPELEPLFTRERTARGSSPERNMLSNNPTFENAQLAFAMHVLRLWNTFEAIRLHEAVRLISEETARAKMGPEPIKGMGRQMDLYAQILDDYGIQVQRTELPAHYDLFNLEKSKYTLGVMQKLMENPSLEQKMKQQLGSLAGPSGGQ